MNLPEPVVISTALSPSGSYAKLRLAKLRGVRWQQFDDHLKETEWRFNHRRDNLFNLLIINLGSSPLIQERP